MKIRFNAIVVLITGIIIGFSVSAGNTAFAEKSKEGSALPLDELMAISQVFSRIKNSYVEDVDDKKLLEGAVRGMLSSLDPHSAFLDEDDYKDLKVLSSGAFGGLGIEVGMEDGFVKVISPIDDTPAKKAGIMAGDLIIKIDGKSVKGMSLGDAVKIMRGKPGEEILLTIAREGEQKLLEIKIIRDVIAVKSIKGRLLGDGFGYIRITQFQGNTSKDLVKKLEDLKKENKGELNGIVLDLRNNPGGLLTAAVNVSDAFLTQGKEIVSINGKSEKMQSVFSAETPDLLNNKPIVVLVNGGSASASEIVAGALQDHKRAVIMGQTTFGKGSVQTTFTLPNGKTAVKITTARYYTPSKKSIQAEGIVPDVKLDKGQFSANKTKISSRFKEADLSGHLDNDNGASEKDSNKKNNHQTEEDLAISDYPLFQALTLLKGLHIYM